MDILQDVRGRKIQYIKLIPSNLKIRENTIRYWCTNQTYNLIEMGKKEQNYFNR
jgi:hypothetical protein